jgi:hypothetical protein
VGHPPPSSFAIEKLPTRHYVDGIIHTNTIESAFAAKAGNRGKLPQGFDKALAALSG